MITRIEQSVQGHPPHNQIELSNGEVWRLYDDGTAKRVITR